MPVIAQSGPKPGDLCRLSISVLENVVQTVCTNFVQCCMRYSFLVGNTFYFVFSRQDAMVDHFVLI